METFSYAMLKVSGFGRNQLPTVWGFPGGTVGKESTCQCRRHKRCGFHPRVGKIPWSRKW